MPAVTGDTASGPSQRAARRLAAIDPLLTVPPVPAGCGAELAVTGPDGSVAGHGTCEHWGGGARGAPARGGWGAGPGPGEQGAGGRESRELPGGAARRFQLTPQIAGPD